MPDHSNLMKRLQQPIIEAYNANIDAERQEAATAIEKLQAALQEIAQQQTCSEMPPQNLAHGDFQLAYDMMIAAARAALGDAPGHTDLMAPPETITGWVRIDEAHPLPIDLTDGDEVIAQVRTVEWLSIRRPSFFPEIRKVTHYRRRAQEAAILAPLTNTVRECTSSSSPPREALEAVDALWSRTFREGPDGARPANFSPIPEEILTVWRAVRAALSPERRAEHLPTEQQQQDEK